jgi:hypothetical protein
MLKFIAVGPPKTGTTLLQNILIQNPFIFLPEKKEIQYFNFNYDKGPDWFHKHYLAATAKQSSGEISPSYSNSYDTFQKIKAYGDTYKVGLKIIFTYRDPVKRIVSEYYHHLRRQDYDLNFNDVIEKEMTEKNAGRFFKTIRYSSYNKIMHELMSLFDRKDIMVINADKELYDASQLPLTIKKIEQFIGVKEFENYNFNVEENASYAPKSYAVQKIIFQQNIFKKFARNLVPSLSIRNKIRAFIRKSNSRKTDLKDKMREDVKTEAVTVFNQYLKTDYEQFINLVQQ